VWWLLLCDVVACCVVTTVVAISSACKVCGDCPTRLVVVQQWWLVQVAPCRVYTKP
jgi:hypothetical protein